MPAYTTAAHSVGDVIELEVTVTHPTSGISTGSYCRFLVMTPAGVVTSYSTGDPGFASSTAGVYTAAVTSTAGGDYIWRFSSTGTVSASTSGRWSVRPVEVST